METSPSPVQVRHSLTLPPMGYEFIVSMRPTDWNAVTEMLSMLQDVDCTDASSSAVQHGQGRGTQVKELQSLPGAQSSPVRHPGRHCGGSGAFSLLQ